MAQETEDPSVKDRVLYDSTDRDPLFRLEVICADAQIAGEMEQLEQILLRREALKHQDITKSMMQNLQNSCAVRENINIRMQMSRNYRLKFL